jgi:hypothetical protein
MDHTDWLDIIGLLAIAAGVGLGLFWTIGWWSLCISGGVVLIGSQLATWVDRHRNDGGD